MIHDILLQHALYICVRFNHVFIGSDVVVMSRADDVMRLPHQLGVLVKIVLSLFQKSKAFSLFYLFVRSIRCISKDQRFCLEAGRLLYSLALSGQRVLVFFTQTEVRLKIVCQVSLLLLYTFLNLFISNIFITGKAVRGRYYFIHLQHLTGVHRPKKNALIQIAPIKYKLIVLYNILTFSSPMCGNFSNVNNPLSPCVYILVAVTVFGPIPLPTNTITFFAVLVFNATFRASSSSDLPTDIQNVLS